MRGLLRLVAGAPGRAEVSAVMLVLVTAVWRGRAWELVGAAVTLAEAAVWVVVAWLALALMAKAAGAMEERPAPAGTEES